MPFFRGALRLAVQGPGSGRAYFRWKSPDDPVLERWDPVSPPGSWRLLRRVDRVCAGRAGVPFLHLDIRTPYGESLAEEPVWQALREALGPRADGVSLQGWHVAHLEDTHQGSNHRVFATLEELEEDADSVVCDQSLPLESAVQALGDWMARQTAQSHFQLILSEGERIYSLAYRNAQPYHLLRVAANPRDFALKRLAEHREYLRPEGGGEVPVFMEAADPWRSACVDALGVQPENIPTPPGFSSDAGPNLWHFSLALAAVGGDAAIHNRVSAFRRNWNVEIRLWDRMLKAAGIAALLGGAVIALEAARHAALGRELRAARVEALRYAEKVSSLDALRRERESLLDSLSALRPLWSGPLPLDRILRGIVGALPPDGGMEGIMLRTVAENRRELSFRAWVEDWNHIRPLQEKWQRLPFFSGVELSDQRKEAEHRRVVFQATCILAGLP